MEIKIFKLLLLVMIGNQTLEEIFLILKLTFNLIVMERAEPLISKYVIMEVIMLIHG